MFVVRRTFRSSGNKITEKNILKHASTMEIFLSPVYYRRNLLERLPQD